ncbi:hypothetical protein O1L44_03320 [Streptomyces noursei]|nr:hypothetical protein [Streptomyces noursei]
MTWTWRMRKRVGGVLLLALVLMAGRCCRPGGSRAPDAGARDVGVAAVLGRRRGAYRDALAHAGQLHTVSPFWYEATSERAVTGRPGAVRPDMVAGCTGPASRWCPR